MGAKLSDTLVHLAYSGSDRQTFQRFQDEIDRVNHKFIFRVDVFTFCALIALLFSTLFLRGAPGLTQIYFVFIALYIVEYILRFYWQRSNQEVSATISVWYCMSKLFLFSYLTELYFRADTHAILFYVLLISLPVLFIRPSWQMTVYTGVVCLLFSLFTFLWKEADLAFQDICYLVYCYIFSVFISYWINEIRVRSIRSECLLTDQRDTDVLTGLVNRLCFNNYISQAFQWSSREKLTVFMIDVDYFKSYNDHYGHLAGDDALGRLGTFFRTYAERNDLFFARYGGEEFVAVDSTHDRKQIETIAGDLVEGIRALAIPHDTVERGFLTVSVGYARQDRVGASSYVELINSADEALYRAKSEGRNCAVASVRKIMNK